MAVNMNKLTEKAQEALVAAQRLAEDHHNTQLEPDHLLVTLVSQQDGVVPAVLEKLGVPARTIAQQADAAIGGLARASGSSQVYVSQPFRQVYEAAQQEAERLKDEYVSTEHLLLGLVDGAGQAAQILKRANVTRDRIYQALQEVRGGQRVTSQNPESTYQSL